MTTEYSRTTTLPRSERFVLPDAPPWGPDDMTTSKHLATNGNAIALRLYLGDWDTTIFAMDRYFISGPRMPESGWRLPDLLVSFDADPELYERDNGYIVANQGKPPDFVMEVGSRSTGERDVGVKRGYYASLGVPEYWRFDETGGSYQGVPLAGERLVDGEYEPIAIDTLEEGVHQGYSPTLDVSIRWEWGELWWIDPRTNEPIPDQQSERQGRLEAEQARREVEQELAMERQARQAEAQARQDAEAQARELQASLREMEERLRRGRRQD